MTVKILHWMGNSNGTWLAIALAEAPDHDGSLGGMKVAFSNFVHGARAEGVFLGTTDSPDWISPAAIVRIWLA